jgi:hypothetical protein
MRLPLIALLAVVAAASLAATARPAAAGGACTRAQLSWGVKCIQPGQFCKVSGDAEYHRYGFHCHTGGRLSTASTPNNSSGAGCQPGYSPCLPRVPDLNCSDIPSSKRPVRVTGSDPYRLDGDRDGWACE